MVPPKEHTTNIWRRKRIVYDHIKSSEGKLHNFTIIREIIHKAQEKKKSNSKSNKRKLKKEEIVSAKQKKLDLNKAIEEIEADIEEYSVQAIGKKD